MQKPVSRDRINKLLTSHPDFVEAAVTLLVNDLKVPTSEVELLGHLVRGGLASGKAGNQVLVDASYIHTLHFAQVFRIHEAISLIWFPSNVSQGESLAVYQAQHIEPLEAKLREKPDLKSVATLNATLSPSLFPDPTMFDTFVAEGNREDLTQANKAYKEKLGEYEEAFESASTRTLQHEQYLVQPDTVRRRQAATGSVAARAGDVATNETKLMQERDTARAALRQYMTTLATQHQHCRDHLKAKKEEAGFMLEIHNKALVLLEVAASGH